MFSTLEQKPAIAEKPDSGFISDLAKIAALLAKYDFEDRGKQPAPPADKGHQA